MRGSLLNNKIMNTKESHKAAIVRVMSGICNFNQIQFYSLVYGMLLFFNSLFFSLKYMTYHVLLKIEVNIILLSLNGKKAVEVKNILVDII